MTLPPASLPRRTPLRVTVLRIALVVGLVAAAHFAVDVAMRWAESSARSEMMTLGLILGLLAVYALLIAVPFVPGIEVGLSLLAVRGAEVAPFVYLATVAGLMLAHGTGRRVPLDWLARRLAELRLRRAAELVAQVAPLGPGERLTLLRRRLPRRLESLAEGWRYPILALLVNLPGSGLIGGGGGICFVAGVSGLFRPWPTFLTLALAVAPVPLLIWGLGLDARAWISRP